MWNGLKEITQELATVAAIVLVITLFMNFVAAIAAGG